MNFLPFVIRGRKHDDCKKGLAFIEPLSQLNDIGIPRFAMYPYNLWIDHRGCRAFHWLGRIARGKGALGLRNGLCTFCSARGVFRVLGNLAMRMTRLYPSLSTRF